MLTKEEITIARLIHLHKLQIQTNDLKIVYLFLQPMLDNTIEVAYRKMKAQLKLSNRFYYLNR